MQKNDLVSTVSSQSERQQNLYSLTQVVHCWSKTASHCRCVSIDSRNQRLITGGKSVIKLWDASIPKRGRLIGEIECFGNDASTNGDLFVYCCKASDDGQTLFAGGRSSSVDIFQLSQAGPSRVRSLPISAGSYCYALAIADEHCLYVSSSTGRIDRWDLREPQSSGGIDAHRNGVFGISTVDARRFLSYGADQSVRAWDLRAEPRSVEVQHPSPIRTMSFSRTHRFLVTGMYSNQLMVHADPTRGSYIKALTTPICDANIFDAYPLMAYSSMDSTVRGEDLQTGEEYTLLRTKAQEQILALAASGDSLCVATNKSAYLYRVEKIEQQILL